MNDKPKKPRRTRVDSAAGVSAAIVAGGKTIKIPSHVKLSPKQRTIFIELCDEISKSELTAHKITMLASLAKIIEALEDEQERLAAEGSVLINSHGNPIANPRAKHCSTLTGSMLSLRRSLGIHARELAGGDNRRTGIMRSHNMANESLMDGMDDDDLIAQPNVVPINRGKDLDDDS